MFKERPMKLVIRKDSITCLPEEIQAYILSKLDGKSAAVCKCVCKMWRDIFSGMEAHLHFWLRACLKEIPLYTLIELSKLFELSDGMESLLADLSRNCNGSSIWSKLPWIFWREIYAEFSRYSYIRSGKEKRTELFYPPVHGQVSCLYLKDHAIFTGHESGAVMCWKNIDCGLTCDILYRHHKRVTSISSLDMVLSTANVLNGLGGNKIVSSSRDTTLILYNLDTEQSSVIKYYTKQVNNVRTWGNCFVAAAAKSLIQGQPLWKSVGQSNHIAEITCTLFSHSVSDITAVAFWENSVLSGNEMGNLFHWKGCLGCDQATQQDMIHVANFNSPIKSIYCLGHRIICYTGDNHLHISKYKEDFVFTAHDVYTTLQKTAECVAVTGSILAIGCRSGAVFLYHLPHDKHWDNIDLTIPARIIQTSHDHINFIVIGDDGCGPFVILATEQYYITCVQFQKHKHYVEKTLQL